MTPRILVTGVTGQLGYELVPRLRSLGEVVPVSRHEMDLGDRDAILRVLREVKPTVIVNPAAWTAVDRAEDEVEAARLVNATAPAVLAEEAARSGATVIHYSTDYVYSDAGDSPLDERTPISPINAYGRTKAEGDRLVAELSPRHVILRTSWVYGAHGANFVRTMLRLGAERDVLRVVADQVGAPTSAPFIADATVQVVRACLAREPAELSGVYHLTCSGFTSWHGFAEEIFREARALGTPLKVERVEPIASSEYPMRARRPTNSRLDCTKLSRTFGVTLLPWADALATVLPGLVGK